MGLRNELNFLLALGFGLVSSQTTPTVPSIKDKNFIEGCVRVHNELRRMTQPSAANMLYMTWDETLAKNAKAWANQCNFAHNPNIQNAYYCHPAYKYVGENIWLGKLRIFTIEDAIGIWYNETEFYNYTNLHCSKVCGHYTQIVWADSYKVGCAMTICPELGGATVAIFVCNYGPPGNYLETKPYIEGEPCSKCEKEDTCKNKLCRNKNREKLAEYPNWKPKWETLQSNLIAEAQYWDQQAEVQHAEVTHSKTKEEAPQWAACNLLCLVYIYLGIF